jgi:hypothetical protein
MALEKAAKSPLFPLNLRLLSQKLKFWESLSIDKKKRIGSIYLIMKRMFHEFY